jgi:transposase-like protein
LGGNVVERLRGARIMGHMRKGDIICPECRAGIRRIELTSRKGHAGEFRCPLCNYVLEVSDGSSEIVYRLTVAPERLFE